MTWKLWKTIRGCKIMRQPLQHHPKGYFEYEVFAPDNYHFDSGEHSKIETDEESAEDVARNHRLEKCDENCD